MTSANEEIDFGIEAVDEDNIDFGIETVDIEIEDSGTEGVTTHAKIGKPWFRYPFPILSSIRKHWFTEHTDFSVKYLNCFHPIY